jgi:hypothetical protein
MRSFGDVAFPHSSLHGLYALCFRVCIQGNIDSSSLLLHDLFLAGRLGSKIARRGGSLGTCTSKLFLGRRGGNAHRGRSVVAPTLLLYALQSLAELRGKAAELTCSKLCITLHGIIANAV